MTGIRGAYERLIKVGYGLSILGTVPLVVLPFQGSIGPVVSAWTQAWSKSADKKVDEGSNSLGRSSYLQEQFIATLVLGIATSLLCPALKLYCACFLVLSLLLLHAAPTCKVHGLRYYTVCGYT